MQRGKDRRKKGRGILNRLIDKIPIELHLPGGYRYCGPGTHLAKRLARGDKGINPLDEACKRHDIAYASSKDDNVRRLADQRLAEEAWERVKAKDSSIGEKAGAWAVTNAMKVKTKFGGSCSFKSAVRKIKKQIGRGNNLSKTIADALLIAKRLFPKKLGKRKIPRVIPIPKTGGILPLIPIFAGLGALGSIVSGVSSVAKAINDTKVAREKLQEEKRHNLAMEGKQVGKGLYLAPYKKGYGLYLRPWKGEGLKKKKNSHIFLSNLPPRPLADFEIQRIGKRYIKHFRGVFSRNDLPKRPLLKENIIINMDDKNGGGTHWVALSKIDKDIVYYDSFGNLSPPIEVVNYVKGLNIKYNREREQSWNSSVCGHLSLLFLHERSLKAGEDE